MFLLKFPNFSWVCTESLVERKPLCLMGAWDCGAQYLSPWKLRNVPWKGTSLKGKFIFHSSSNHQFPEDTILVCYVFRGVCIITKHKMNPPTSFTNFVHLEPQVDCLWLGRSSCCWSLCYWWVAPGVLLPFPVFVVFVAPWLPGREWLSENWSQPSDISQLFLWHFFSFFLK